MSVTSLENKTIRPGRLVGYSYYYSNRRPSAPTKLAKQPSTRHQGTAWRRWGFLSVAVLGVLIFAPLLRGGGPSTPAASRTSSTSTPPTQAHSVVPPAPVSKTDPHCTDNNLSQFILVSISARHLWVCQDKQSIYDSPVVTGIDYLAADKTPVGTYHIYNKQTNLTLTGSDSTGSWSDPVHYWMPFLANKYGTYGLHDATWRDNSAFGNISPNSADASHGCVELPLDASAWLYNWTQSGTTITIKT